VRPDRDALRSCSLQKRALARMSGGAENKGVDVTNDAPAEEIIIIIKNII